MTWERGGKFTQFLVIIFHNILLTVHVISTWIDLHTFNSQNYVMNCLQLAQLRLPTCTCTCSLTGHTLTCMVDSHGCNVMVIRALHVWCCGILLWNTVNYSMVVDQSDYGISTILYNFMSQNLAYNYWLRTDFTLTWLLFKNKSENLCTCIYIQYVYGQQFGTWIVYRARIFLVCAVCMGRRV